MAEKPNDQEVSSEKSSEQQTQSKEQSPPVPPTTTAGWGHRIVARFLAIKKFLKHDPNREQEISARKEQALERFWREVEDAQDLLEFALSEKGEEVKIEDRIIDAIKKAEEFLYRADLPSPEDRATFAKAYRDLSHALAPVSTSLLHPPSWQQSRYYWRLLIGLFLIIWCSGYFLIPGTPFFMDKKDVGWRDFAIRALFFSFALTGLTAFIFRFGLFFLGAVTRRKLDQMIAFCYLFTLFSILSPVLFVGSFLLAPDLYRLLAVAPISYVLGCSEFLPGETGDLILQPKEIRCSCFNQFVSTPSDPHQPGPDTCIEDNRLWLLNVGGGTQMIYDRDYRNLGAYTVKGGLPVPLYIIILSLFGGAVSMTRKIPEYQRGALDPKDPMTPAKARENLVFQIMQVVSAPLIAIAVYHLVAPSTRSVSVVLGFASGFASETILLAIRSLVEKLAPAIGTASVSPNLISVSVNPPTVTLSAGASQLFTATVANSPNPAVTWSMEPPDVGSGSLSPTGSYKAPDEIKEQKKVTIIAVSAADPTKQGPAVVTLEPDKAPTENSPAVSAVTPQKEDK